MSASHMSDYETTAAASTTQASPRILIVADDLTGGNACGALFAEAGLRTITVTDTGPAGGVDISGLLDDFDAVVVNTDSRHLPTQQASELYTELIETAGAVDLVACRIDTTLRGNVGPAAAAAIAARFEADLDAERISLDDLFDRDYQAVHGTDPARYHTRFDGYADQVLPAIQEPLLTRDPALVYAIAITPDGYVPTHNNVFNQPLTGDPAVDHIHSRSKRIFNDRTGARCGSHERNLLLQTYSRDTGELMHDLSVPIHVRGRHWGGVRLGYRPRPDEDQAPR